MKNAQRYPMKNAHALPVRHDRASGLGPAATVPALAVAALLAAPALVSAQDFEWSGEIEAGNAVEVRGVNGDVRARPAADGTAEVTATKRAGRRGDPDDVEIEVVEHGDGVTICVLYPASGGDSSDGCRPGGAGQSVENNDTEVDFRVGVPAGVRFTGGTVNGSVEAESLEADVRMESVNGTLRVSTAGPASARTVNGSIEASVGRADGEGDMEFRTVNGSITLAVPAGLDARVRASTMSGSISTDFPLEIRESGSGGANLDDRLGDGGGELRLETVNGGIELRRGNPEGPR